MPVQTAVVQESAEKLAEQHTSSAVEPDAEPAELPEQRAEPFQSKTAVQELRTEQVDSVDLLPQDC